MGSIFNTLRRDCIYAHSPTANRQSFIKAGTTGILSPEFNCKNVVGLLLMQSNDHTAKNKKNATQLEKHSYIHIQENPGYVIYSTD